MIREDIGIIITMDNIPDAPANAYKPSRKRKQSTSEAQKETQNPHKKKASTYFHKEVKALVSSTILMPSKTISEAIGKTPHKITSSSDKPAPSKKPRKMILPIEEEEEEEIIHLWS